MENLKRRNWCFTQILDATEPNESVVNNVSAYIKEDENADIKYAIWQLERAPSTGKLHIQGYAEFPQPVRLQRAKEILGSENVHLEPRKGTADQAIHYCMKPVDGCECDHCESEKKTPTKLVGPWTIGEHTPQGSRTDLKSVTEAIKLGANLYEIVEHFTPTYIKYHNGLEKAMAILQRPKEYHKEIEVHVIYGPPGTGKTRKAVESSNFDNIYRLDLKHNTGSLWFDGYVGQEYLVIDEFRAQIKFSMLLQILDCYHMQVPVKGGRVWAKWNHVIITTNILPSKWYKWKDKTQKEALKRRINHVYSKETLESELKEITFDDSPVFPEPANPHIIKTIKLKNGNLIKYQADENWKDLFSKPQRKGEDD